MNAFEQTISILSLENLTCPYCQELEFSQKYGRFYEVAWKFALPLIITSWKFHKAKAILLMWLANLNCPYYHELKFSQRKDSLNDITWKFDLPLISWECLQKYPRYNEVIEYMKCPYYHEAKNFAKIMQFRWCDLKIWSDPIITGWIFCKNIPDLMKSFEHLNCPHYYEL